eukprot:scaffold7595_cov267-Pinguiococcus_pyrenoidosus.AAC.13
MNRATFDPAGGFAAFSCWRGQRVRTRSMICSRLAADPQSVSATHLVAAREAARQVRSVLA